MKFLRIFFLCAMFNLLWLACDECDAVEYQIYWIKPVPNSNMCEYKAQAMRGCSTWRKKSEKVFIDSCGKYVITDYFLKSYLDATYP